MDFLFHRRAAGQSVPEVFDFLEVQEVYSEHFAVNRSRLGPIGTHLNFLRRNYDTLAGVEYADAFDLIVCNPPYFSPGQGKLSPSEFKNRCRFFIDSNLQNLLTGVLNSLKPGGACFMTLRQLSEHGFDILAEVRSFSENKLQVEDVGQIRGTHLLKLTKAETKDSL